MITSYLIRLLTKMCSIHLTYTSWQVHSSYIAPVLVIASMVSLFVFGVSSIF